MKNNLKNKLLEIINNKLGECYQILDSYDNKDELKEKFNTNVIIKTQIEFMNYKVFQYQDQINYGYRTIHDLNLNEYVRKDLDDLNNRLSVDFKELIKMFDEKYLFVTYHRIDGFIDTVKRYKGDI